MTGKTDDLFQETLYDKPEPEEDKKLNITKKPKIKNQAKSRKELEKLKEENAKLKDQLLRKMAEFDNYRKRTNKEVGEIISRASERLVTKLLPVIDDFERSLEHSGKNEVESVDKGFEMIYNKFYKTLEEAGLKILDSDGVEFNPELHEALMQIDDKKVPPMHVVQTLEKGYTLNNKVLRHAKVSVSKE